MKEQSRSLISVFLVLLMTTTAFSTFVMAAGETGTASVVSDNGVSPIETPRGWEDIVQPSLKEKIKSKEMADILVLTTDVSSLYNLVKDYRYKGLIGPDAKKGEMSVIRLDIDAGIIPDIASLPGVLGVYDTAEPIPNNIANEIGGSTTSSQNVPDSQSSTVEHMADKAWDLGYTGEGVRIATMDSGVDFAHYDLNGQQARVPETAQKEGDIIMEATTGTENGESFPLAFYPVIASSIVVGTYNPETRSYGTISASDYTLDAANGIITFNTDLDAGLRVYANYTYDSPYADWPMAFDPISMSSYLSSGGSASGWYVDTSTTDLHIYHPVTVDGVNDFWTETDSIGGASSVYPINETTDLRGSDSLNDIQDPAFDLGNLYISTDADNFYFGFERQSSLTNMSYGIYIDTATGGATIDAEAKNIIVDLVHRPEFAIYVPHIGVRWGVTAAGNLWSENDTVREPKLYRWSGSSWAPAQAITTLGTMVVDEHVITGDATANDTFAQLDHSDVSPNTFRLYINQTPFPSDGYSVDWTTGNITFASDLPYLASVTADYDYSPDPTNASDFASSANFMEFRVPKALLGNPTAISMEVFTVGNNNTHAQDTTPSDENVQYSSPDWSTSNSTTLTSFASRNATPVSYVVGDIPSKSGVYHIGYHPDQNLATYFYGRPVAMLLTDELQAGVYDTVYVDLDDDKNFSDEKPASLFGAYNEREGIAPEFGAKLYANNYTLRLGADLYPLYKLYRGEFSGYQEVIVGDGNTISGYFNNSNLIAGSESLHSVLKGSNLTFNNERVVYNCTGTESTGAGSTWQFYLPNMNIVNYTYMLYYYPISPYEGYYNFTYDYKVEINNLTGLVTVTDVNGYGTVSGMEIHAWYTYDKTVNLTSPANYTIDWDNGQLSMTSPPASGEVIYTTGYEYYFHNNTLYEPYDPTAFIYKEGRNITVEVRTETIYKDTDNEGLNGDGLPYQDLSGGMVYFISRAESDTETFTASDGQDNFTLANGNINPSSFHLYLNGTIVPSKEYKLNRGDRLTPGFVILETPAGSGDIVQAVYEYNALPIPYSDVMSERSGVPNTMPTNGNLVCLFGEFSADSAKGTEVASEMVAKGLGVDGEGNTLVQGMAPDAKIIAIRGGDPFNGWYFGVEGYDGVINSGDEAQIIANSFSYAIPQSGWDLYSRFADYITIDYSSGHTAIVSGSGSVGSYGYGTIGAPGAARGVITVGIGTDFHYRNYNPKAPSDLMRRYGDGGTMAHDGEILPSSARGPTMTGNPKPDIVASGAFCYGDTPLNVDQNMFSGGWEWMGGQWAWDLWSGDALSAAVGAGGLALVYQAYYESHGYYPDAETAKNILKSGADNLNYDVFSQGAGSLNVYRACQIAAGTNGLSIDRTEWIPGDFHGESYANFATLAKPNKTYTQSFNITNQNSTNMDLSIRGEIFHSFGEKTITMDMKKFYDDKDTPGVINIKPYIPERTEFMRVTAYVPYADGYTNMMEFFDWTDENGNRILEFPGEQNRMEYCINSNMLQLTVRDPLSQVHDGLAIQIKGFGGTPVQEPWTIKMEFFERTTWDWVSVDTPHMVLAPGETREINATVSIPADAPAGTYEGGIYVTKNMFNMPVAVGEGYVMNYSDMWYISAASIPNTYSVNNSAVTGGGEEGKENANVLPGSAYFTFIPYHEVFDAPVSGISSINITNTSQSSYVLWHTVNSTVSGISHDNPGGGANTSRDWHIMNESTTPGKYNYTIDAANHTIHLYGGEIVGEVLIDAVGGETSTVFANKPLRSYTIYKNGTEWPENKNITKEVLINATGGETTASFSNHPLVKYIIYKNGTVWNETGNYTVDMQNGTITFTNPLGSGDNITADYTIPHYNYTVNMQNGTITFTNPLGSGDNITADYVYGGLNKGERVTIYFLNGSFNLTEGRDFEYFSGKDYQISLSPDIQNRLDNNPNSTITASYVWSYTEGTWEGSMERNLVSGTVTIYSGSEQWNQYVQVTGERLMTAAGGETEIRLGNSSILLDSTTLYSNGSAVQKDPVSVSNETIVSSATGGETSFTLAHANVVSSTAKLYLNGNVVDQLAEVTVFSPEWCFDANSTRITGEDVTATAANISGRWVVTTSHNLSADGVALVPGSYILYENGIPLVASVDYEARTNATDGLLTGDFELYNYHSASTYVVDYSYYDPYIKGGYLAHGNVVEESYKIYRNGLRMNEDMHYELNLTSGYISLKTPLGPDEYITAAYSYNQYKLFPSGELTLTQALNAGDSLSMDYDYYPYLLDLSSGLITLADPLTPGEVITADYTYAAFRTDLINGIVHFNNWLYPGTVVTGDYSVYQTVIPVCINVPVSFPNVHFGGNNSIIQDMYNNTVVYGGEDNRYYFMDIPTTGLYEDPGNRQFFIDTKWSSAGTDINTDIYSKSRQTSYPGATFENSRIGPYSVSKSGGSTSTSGVFTTTGGPEEILFSPMNNALNILQLKGTIMAGTESYEAFDGSLGLIDISDIEMDITTSSTVGKQSVTTMASLERYGISGAAAGPSSPQSYPNEIIYQDDADWSHFDSFIDQLLSGRYTRAVEVSDSALIFDVHITSKECPDLDLAVFLDGDSNGDHVVDSSDDPTYVDGKPEASEFVAMCADADADEQVTLVTPAPGTYLIRVFGFDVPGGKNTFSMDITLVQGTGFKVAGEDSNTIPAYQPKELNITWNFDEDSPDGTFMGAFYIGTYNAPMSMLLPVSLTLERTAPEITKMSPAPSSTVTTSNPTISVSYEDPTAETGQKLISKIHTAPAHLWGASSDEWETNTVRAEVPGVGMDPTGTEIYIDNVDVTDEIISTSTVARYTPETPLYDGIHTVRVVTRDLVGNEMSTSWSFEVDTTSPTISIEDIPLDGVVYTQSDTYTVRGHIQPGSVLEINGAAINVSDDGSFEYSINLSGGQNLITITATDYAGNQNMRELLIVKDVTAPTMSVSIQGPRIRNVPSVTVTGTVDLISEPGGVSVTVNDIPVVVYLDGSFSAHLSLSEGDNNITVVATDAAGNTATKQLQITADTKMPSLILDSVPGKVSEKLLTISGTAEPGAKVYVNGKQIITSNGAFSTQVSLSVGSNIITVSAEDAAGNSVEYTLGVDYQPEDEVSALTASTTAQATPALTSTAAMLIVLAAIIFLIIGFIASRFIGGKKGGEEGGAAAAEPVQEIAVGEEEVVEEEVPEEEMQYEEPEERTEVPEEPEDISDEIMEAVEEQAEPEETIEEDFEPAKPEVSLEEAESLFSTGDMVGAMGIYEELLEQDPENIPALIGKAKTLNATGKWGKALQATSEALKLDPNNADALVLKGDIFAEQGKTEMARQAYEQALHIDPSNSEIPAKIQKL